MHVGFFIDGYYPVIDGVINVVDAYASRLLSKCDVTVFTPRTRNFEAGYDNRFPYKVIRCKSVMREHDDYPQGFPQVDMKFRKLLDESRLDIMHIHSPYPVGLFAKSYARKHDIPMVGTIHSDFRPDVLRYLGKVIGEPVIRLMMSEYNACEECWTVNDTVGKVFVRDYGLKVPYRVMPYGTDHRPVADEAAARAEVSAAFGLRDDDFVIAHVGRQDLEKREDFILRSLRILKKSLPDFKMLFVGEGNKTDYLKELTVQVGLSENVQFCGIIRDKELMKKVYSRADLLLFPSLSDTYGLVKIEAACQKTPTLYCKDTMVADGITDNVNGFIEENDEEKYAARIFQLYKDRDLLAKVGEGAKRDLYRTWDNHIDVVYENYQKIIDNHNFVRR